ENGDSLSWENLNRAKRSLALDFARPEARELLVELARSVGNLVTNLPAKGFLAHDKVAQGRADLISVRVMGWPDGAVALDYTANAAVGYPSLTGPISDKDNPEPVNHVLPAWDLLTGAYAAFALLAAVRRREATGEGSEIRLPLSDVAIGSAANMGRLAEVLYTGRDRERLGNAVFGTIGRDFVTRDGVRVMIVAINDRQWAGLVEALGIGAEVAETEAREGARFAADDGLRFTHRATLFALIEHAVAARDHAELVASFAAHGVVHGGYQTMLEAAADPRLVGENPVFERTADNPSGFAYPAAGAFATLAGEERVTPRPAPRNGEHSEQVLAERLGLSSGEIARLIDAGVVGTARTDA
ncbi:MAG TPA: CoA transferase, partial [Novosphingobium sp.]|nr:CoA transferase [Novosphingobium sp.]